MIASVFEAQSGIENLWLRFRSNGRRNYPNFGKHIRKACFKTCFKASVSATSCCFGDKKWWCVDKRGKQWDMLLPFLNKHGYRQMKLMMLMLLVLEKSMSR